MADAALYYPYIEVPDSPALTRVMLYWDELGTIVPLGTHLEDRTIDLVYGRLVRPVDPSEYLEELSDPSDFHSDFVSLITGYERTLQPGDHVLIHREKATGELWWWLERHGLARASRDAGYHWFEVEPGVGALYMAYLAGRLSSSPGLQMEPITDQRQYFSRRAAAGERVDTAALFDQMRGAVVNDILPAPAEGVAPLELARFKDKHWDELGRFRRLVESRLLACAREPSDDLRERMVAELREDLKEGVADISARLRRHHWTPAVGTLCVALGAAPAVVETAVTGNPFPATSAAVAPLADLVHRALTGGRAKPADEPLAYAALAQQRFK